MRAQMTPAGRSRDRVILSSSPDRLRKGGDVMAAVDLAATAKSVRTRKPIYKQIYFWVIVGITAGSWSATSTRLSGSPWGPSGLRSST